MTNVELNCFCDDAHPRDWSAPCCPSHSPDAGTVTRDADGNQLYNGLKDKTLTFPNDSFMLYADAVKVLDGFLAKATMEDGSQRDVILSGQVNGNLDVEVWNPDSNYVPIGVPYFLNAKDLMLY